MQTETIADDVKVDIVRMPHPDTVFFGDAEMVPASYLGYIIANGVIAVPSYWDEDLFESTREKDLEAVFVLKGLYPQHRIVQIPSLDLNDQLLSSLRSLVVLEPKL